MPRVLPYSLVARCLGVLLLVAAALKVQGLAVDPVKRLGIFSAPEFQLAVVEFEVFLALWLLWGKRPLGSWLVALAAFGSFATASFYLAWVGQSSCGCFGRLSLSPWYTFGIDLAVIGLLLVGRPDLRPLRDRPRESINSALAPAAYGIAGITVFAGLLLSLAGFAFGSLPAALAYFRGDRVSVQPRQIQVGEGVVGERHTVTVELTNWTDKPVLLFGGTSDCKCTAVNDLPVTIPARDTRTVSVELSFSGKPGIFTRKAAFLVDDEGYRRVGFSLTGRILKPKDLPAVTSGK
jgi:hypothetical protein